MPILDREPSVWPVDLFDVRMQTHDPDPWLVCHVRPRTEKAVGAGYAAMASPTSCPRTNVENVTKGGLCAHICPSFRATSSS